MDKNTLAINGFELVKQGYSQTEAAKQIGIIPKTFYNWKKRHYDKWLSTGIVNIGRITNIPKTDVIFYNSNPKVMDAPKKIKQKKERIFAFYGTKVAIRELIEELTNE